jgi:hypothetical protein
MVVCACNPSTDVRASGVQEQPGLHNKFKVNLSNIVRPFLKEKFFKKRKDAKS